MNVNQTYCSDCFEVFINIKSSCYTPEVIFKLYLKKCNVFFPLPYIVLGEGNGTPLQCSCLENPRGGGAWWAAVYGVTQSQARLK